MIFRSFTSGKVGVIFSKLITITTTTTYNVSLQAEKCFALHKYLIINNLCRCGWQKKPPYKKGGGFF